MVDELPEREEGSKHCCSMGGYTVNVGSTPECNCFWFLRRQFLKNFIEINQFFGVHLSHDTPIKHSQVWFYVGVTELDKAGVTTMGVSTFPKPYSQFFFPFLS